MLKQLVISISFRHEVEVRDFLQASSHSSGWIGSPEDWEIKSLSVTESSSKGSPKFTALLENKKWEKPTPTFFELFWLKKILKDDSPLFKVEFECFKGLDRKIVSQPMGKSVSVKYIKHKNQCFAVLSSSGDVCYSECSDILYNVFFQDHNEEKSGSQNLAIQIDDKIHPVCGHYVEKRSLHLIYDQDINLSFEA